MANDLPSSHTNGFTHAEDHSNDVNGVSYCGLGETPLGDDKLEPIAVIGFAAQFPQDATSAEGFWQMLSQSRSARTEIPKDRFNIDAFYHPDADRVDTVRSSPLSGVIYVISSERTNSLPC